MLKRLEAHLERLQIERYLDAQGDWKQILRRGFLNGVARGLGFALGFSVLGAIAAALIRELILKNMSGIGGFCADVIRAIEARL